MSDKLTTESAHTGSNSAVWFITGVTIGAAIAMLAAPKSGKDSRQYLTDKGKETLGETGKNFVESSKELFERGRELVNDAAELFERGRKLVKG